MKEQRIADLRNKEIINIHDGSRYGIVSDLVFDMDCGQITALIVPQPYRIRDLFGRGEDLRIPWNSIQRIGDEIILVDYIPDKPGADPERQKISNFFL